MRAFALAKTEDRRAAIGPANNRAPQLTLPDIDLSGFSSPAIFRKASCACGGGCQACQANSGNLKISQPNDPAEIEADAIADKVMLEKVGGVSADPSAHIQTKGNGDSGGMPAGGDIGSRMNSSKSGGSPLDRGTRTFFEPRFGADLAGVRIHTGHEASALNHDLSAKAFTVGSDIYFAENQYRPDAESGRKLLAHELVHVRQGGNAICRCVDKADEAKYDTIISEIQALDAYKNLQPAPKSRADTIIKEGKDKPKCLYYAKKLKILFTTPEKGSAEVATEIRKETAAAVKAEEKRLGTKEAQKTFGAEEAATADPEPEPAVAPDAAPEKKPEEKPKEKKKPQRNWTEYDTRFGGGKYKVDASDMTNIYVKVKINLIPGGEGTWDDVKAIKKLEDAIEKQASVKGFTLNVEFVNPDNDPAFVKDEETVTIFANPRWPNATNWGSDARTCTHELFHVLNFPEDRYDYIESHSKNEKMLIPERLIWFYKQMQKPAGFDNPKSLMASGQKPLQEDVCTIAQLDMATCLKAREKLAPVELNFRIRFNMGYANFSGAPSLSMGAGLDLGIPLTHQRDWMLFLGANAGLLLQAEDDFRTAFLAGGRLGLEKHWNPSSGGAVLGGYLGGGGAFVSDRPSLGAGTNYVPGGYGEVGLSGGYQFSPNLGNLLLQAEVGAGGTTQLRLTDSDGRASDKTMQWVQLGLKASFMF